MATAKKATLNADDTTVKIMVWGEPGCGKSRFSLSAPAPLVIDLEGSTRLYANEFDFYVAGVNAGVKGTENAVKLTSTILKEIIAGEYPDVKTLVIDPVTDLLDCLEDMLVKEYEKTLNGKVVAELNQLEKSKWYAYRKDKSRNMLNQLKDIPMNLILVARTKNVWGKGSDGKMQPIGQTYEALEIVEYLMDVVINLKKDKKDEIMAIVKKSRLGNLPDILEVKDYSSITQAIADTNLTIDTATGETVKPVAVKSK